MDIFNLTSLCATPIINLYHHMTVISCIAICTNIVDVHSLMMQVTTCSDPSRGSCPELLLHHHWRLAAMHTMRWGKAD